MCLGALSEFSQGFRDERLQLKLAASILNPCRAQGGLSVMTSHWFRLEAPLAYRIEEGVLLGVGLGGQKNGLGLCAV